MTGVDPELRQIEAIQAKLAKQREQNRKDFPHWTRIIDQLEAVFGRVKTICVEENGRILGDARQLPTHEIRQWQPKPNPPSLPRRRKKHTR